MNAHRIETTLSENGTLTLHDLPFKAGTPVIVIVLERESEDVAVKPSTPTKNGES